MHDSEGGPQAPAINTKYIVDDSPTKASVITIVSLMLFGSSLFGALMRYASVGDLNSIRALLMRDDTIGWISTVVVTLTPTFWLVWRTVRSWFKKKQEVEIVENVDDRVAITKSTAQALMAPPPPSRARETATPGTRLVDGSVLLHRGGRIPVLGQGDRITIHYDPGTPVDELKDGPTRAEAEAAAIGVAVKGAIADGVLSGMSEVARAAAADRFLAASRDVQKRGTDFDDMMANPTIAQFLGAPHTAPLIPGDALAAPAAEPRDSKSLFTETHDDWKRAGKPGPFDQFLEQRGWEWDEDNKRWTHPEAKD